MSIPDYPNQEHANADKAARRRALAVLDHLVNEAAIMRRRIEGDRVDGDDSRQIASLARDLTQHVAIIGALRDVREWHAADLAEREAENAETDRLVAEHFADGHVHGGCPRDAGRSEGKG